jgi:hypothetical protein
MQHITSSIILFVLMEVFPVTSARTEEKQILLRDDFTTLDNWMPFYFPNIK